MDIPRIELLGQSDPVGAYVHGSRRKDQRADVLEALNDCVLNAALIVPDDLLITLYEECDGARLAYRRLEPNTGLFESLERMDLSSAYSWVSVRSD